MRAQHNQQRTHRLLRGFDRAVTPTQGFLMARYGSALARKLMKEARQEYARLILDLPDLQGSKLHAYIVIYRGGGCGYSLP